MIQLSPESTSWAIHLQWVAAPIYAFYSTRSWIEGDATKKLENVASLPGVIAVAGMPDLHPEKYGPVGCSVLADRTCPLLVGSDIGCGMGLFQLNLAVPKLRVEKAAGRLRALDAPWEGSVAEALAEPGLAPNPSDASLGSIGGGNHFCELQAIEEIVLPEAAAEAGLDRSLSARAFRLAWAWLFDPTAAAGGGAHLGPASEAGHAYLAEHEAAPCAGRR